MIIQVEEGRVKGYLTTKEFAEKCNVNEGTVRAWIKRDKIKSLKIGSDNWIRERTPKPDDKRLIHNK